MSQAGTNVAHKRIYVSFNQKETEGHADRARIYCMRIKTKAGGLTSSLPYMHSNYLSVVNTIARRNDFQCTTTLPEVRRLEISRVIKSLYLVESPTSQKSFPTSGGLGAARCSFPLWPTIGKYFLILLSLDSYWIMQEMGTHDCASRYLDLDVISASKCCISKSAVFLKTAFITMTSFFLPRRSQRPIMHQDSLPSHVRQAGTYHLQYL